jgi:protein TonB
MSIDIHGAVAAARILHSSGHALLDEAARKAALTWRFAPALRDGEPVPQLRNQPFTFRLSGAE